MDVSHDEITYFTPNWIKPKQYRLQQKYFER